MKLANKGVFFGLVMLFIAAVAEAQTGTLVVLNKAEASASLLETSSGREIVRLPTGVGPHEAAVSPDGRTVVICNYGGQQPGNSLTVIDLPSARVVKTIDLTPYHRPHGIAFLADGKRVALTSETEKALVIVDIAAGKVLNAIGTEGETSHMLALSPAGDRAYVANIRSGSVTVIDLDSGTRLAVISTAAGAEGIEVTPDGSQVWVCDRAADTVSIIDAATLRVTANLPSATFPIRVKFTPDGTRALVSNAYSGEVAVFDIATHAEIKRIAMNATAVEQREGRMFADAAGNGPVPVGILIEPNGARAFVACTNADIITIIDLNTLAVSGRFTAGKEPDGMAWSAVLPEK